MIDIQSPTAEIRRGKKKERRRRRKKQDENIMVCPITYGDHNEAAADIDRMSDNNMTVKQHKARAC